ncbi:MAG TPA: YkyA family protein, partial [Sporolactobacillaceae bacterium]|nr:YkyA family protein [Sporolactobacillaceae bacterium]
MRKEPYKKVLQIIYVKRLGWFKEVNEKAGIVVYKNDEVCYNQNRDGTNARGGTVLLETKIKNIGIFCLIIVLMLLMPGCTSQGTGDKAFNNLEKAAGQEEVFNQQQKPLIDEEKAEQDLYQKIMALDISKYDQIKAYSD